MWNNDMDDGSFRDEGGFDNNATFSSPAQPNERTSKPKCIANVAIKQILTCPEEGLKIKDKELQMVKVVGIVTSVEVTSVKIKYVISDFTGSITGFLYLDNENESGSSVVENTYCSVTGSIRSQGSLASKHLMIFTISPLTDFNQIMEHILSVVHVPLKLDSLGSAAEEKPIKQEMLTSYGTETNHQYEVDPRYRRIFDVISKSMSENGMSISEIQSALPVKVPVDQIRAGLEYLVGEGHIFTTIDEHHYKSIDSAY